MRPTPTAAGSKSPAIGRSAAMVHRLRSPSATQRPARTSRKSKHRAAARQLPGEPAATETSSSRYAPGRPRAARRRPGRPGGGAAPCGRRRAASRRDDPAGARRVDALRRPATAIGTESVEAESQKIEALQGVSAISQATLEREQGTILEDRNIGDRAGPQARAAIGGERSSPMALFGRRRGRNDGQGRSPATHARPGYERRRNHAATGPVAARSAESRPSGQRAEERNVREGGRLPRGPDRNLDPARGRALRRPGPRDRRPGADGEITLAEHTLTIAVQG